MGEGSAGGRTVMTQENNNGGGIGFFGLLTIAFIVMKCLNQITWSWLWVLSPLWLPIAIVLVFYLIICIVSVIKVMSKKKEVTNNEKDD